MGEDAQEFKYWSCDKNTSLKHYKSQESGLSAEEAELRLQKNGFNVLREEKKSTSLMLFASQFKNPIIVILIAATGISAVTGELVDASIIMLIILASSVLSFFQEYSANNAIERLRVKVQVKSIVLRDKKEIQLPSKYLVAGDVVRLSAGSLVPADGLILESLEFFVNQSVLTGESLPVEKMPGIIHENATIEERTNCVFMGTNVQNGYAVVLVTKTGTKTEFGLIADKLALRNPDTEFERGVRRFGYMLTQMILILTFSVFVINVIFEKPAIESLLFSVAIAVGITPQLLPAIISITLSKGSRAMADEGVIVRRLASIENFGSMDVLCTDKTGTLTEGVIRIDGARDAEGNASEEVFRLSYMNAKLQTGMSNSLDDAICSYKEINLDNIKKTGEVPFDFTRGRLSVVIEENNERLMITKGAFKNVIDVCSRIEKNNESSELNDLQYINLQKLFSEWSNNGIRVLGVAKKSVEVKNEYKIEDEVNLTFVGFLLLYDHPKAGVAKTVEEIGNKGISLKVITGDNKLIALNTAKAVGIHVTGVITGPELMKMTDESLRVKVERTNLFAEVDPNQKERIILALKKKCHVVGYMGDGINDVPALRAADVSISVDNAVDVAKESADFVLMEKSLDVLNSGIKLGRTTLNNTLKYILVTTSANFGNMLSMAGTSLFLPFLPLLPKQILLINFMSDIPAISISSDYVDEEMLERPRKWDIRFIRDYMFVFGAVSSVFDYLTFALLFFSFRVKNSEFQSSWFLFSIFTELTALLVMRTRKPFYKSKPAPILLYSSVMVGIAALLLPYLPFHELINITVIRLPITVSLIFIVCLYVLLTEAAKRYFYRWKSK